MNVIKSLIGALLLATGITAAFAQSTPVQWPIDAVTVYQQGAKIEREGQVVLDAQGKAVVTLTGLSSAVHQEMLQVSLGEGWSLASHVFKTAVPSSQSALVAQQQADIDAAIRSNRQTYALREALLFTYEEELAMIRSNRSVNGGELLLVDDLRDHANFWRERVKELSYLMLELRMEMDELTAEWDRLEADRMNLEQSLAAQEGQWTLRFAGAPGSKSMVRVSYVVTGAGWAPVYDAEVSETGQMEMKRYASVYQTTGNDWEEVPTTFVVGNPLQSIAPPTVAKKELGLTVQNAANAYAWEAQASFDDYDGFDEVERRAVSASHSVDRYEFEPASPVFIDGDGTRERVFIESFELAGELNYLLLPEFAEEAYQLVNSGAWTTARLVPGRVQVIAGGMYRGAYFMRLPAPGDTLQVPLGQDVRVRSSRERVLDRCTSTVFGGSRKTQQSFEITVENQHNRPIDVVIQDAVPVSNSSDIEVEVLGLSGGELDAVSGEVVWDLQLAPNERKTLSFGYIITYPKRRSLQGL